MSRCNNYVQFHISLEREITLIFSDSDHTQVITISATPTFCSVSKNTPLIRSASFIYFSALLKFNFPARPPAMLFPLQPTLLRLMSNNKIITRHLLYKCKDPIIMTEPEVIQIIIFSSGQIFDQQIGFGLIWK